MTVPAAPHNQLDLLREFEALKAALEQRDAAIADRDAAIAERDAAIAERDAKIIRLQHHVELYRKLAFGKSSEKRRPEPQPGDPRQGILFSMLLSEADLVAQRAPVEGTVEEIASARPRKKAKRRSEFPDHVPHFKTTYELEAAERVCSCGESLDEIGEAVTKELERLETTLVHLIARKKYGCARCGASAKTAPGPDRVIDGGLLGPGFLAHVIVERFLNHMPYYRQEQKYQSEGLSITRTVLERSAARCAEILKPIDTRNRSEILSQDVVFTDDTSVTIAQSSKGKSRTGRIWTYCDKEGRIAYDFTESRKRDGPLEVLKEFKGYVHADAYPGYDRLYLPGEVREVACFAHLRRYVLEAEAEEPALVKEGLAIIRSLYRVEAAATESGFTPEQRHALRQERSRPILSEFSAWLDRAELEILPKGKLADAVRYAKNHWKAFQTYLEDGRLEIDNNRAERSLRPFAVGRKNWLFFQTQNGGATAAILMSLVQTAKAIGLDPKIYLRDVLLRIGHETDVAKLTPHGWKKHFADDVMKAFRSSTPATVAIPGSVPPA
jgi:transposase